LYSHWALTSCQYQSFPTVTEVGCRCGVRPEEMDNTYPVVGAIQLIHRTYVIASKIRIQSGGMRLPKLPGEGSDASGQSKTNKGRGGLHIDQVGVVKMQRPASCK
jgi:hypothetical protein